MWVRLIGVGVNEGLLVDAPDALERADVESILSPAPGQMALRARFV
jgi:hypothetical protein